METFVVHDDESVRLKDAATTDANGEFVGR